VESVKPLGNLGFLRLSNDYLVLYKLSRLESRSFLLLFPSIKDYELDKDLYFLLACIANSSFLFNGLVVAGGVINTYYDFVNSKGFLLISYCLM